MYRLKPVGGSWTDEHYYKAKDGFWYSVDQGVKFESVVDDTKARRRKEVLVYVDAQGQETGYGHPSTAGFDGSFTSIGCWHSLLIRP